MFIVLALHLGPIHPRSHSKQVPLSMWQVLYKQLMGQVLLQYLPYTPEVSQPISDDSTGITFLADCVVSKKKSTKILNS